MHRFLWAVQSYHLSGDIAANHRWLRNGGWRFLAQRPLIRWGKIKRGRLVEPCAG